MKVQVTVRAPRWLVEQLGDRLAEELERLATPDEKPWELLLLSGFLERRCRVEQCTEATLTITLPWRVDGREARYVVEGLVEELAWRLEHQPASTQESEVVMA